MSPPTVMRGNIQFDLEDCNKYNMYNILLLYFKDLNMLCRCYSNYLQPHQYNIFTYTESHYLCWLLCIQQ